MSAATRALFEQAKEFWSQDRRIPVYLFAAMCAEGLDPVVLEDIYLNNISKEV